MECVEAYNGAPSQIIARCRNCDVNLSYFNAMYKFKKHWWTEEFGLVKEIWENEKLLCHVCYEPIGCEVESELVKFYKNKLYFWYETN